MLSALVLAGFIILDLPLHIIQEGRFDMTTTPKEPIAFNCPCNYRRTINKDYVCWGIRCPLAGLEKIVDAEPVDPITFDSSDV